MFNSFTNFRPVQSKVKTGWSGQVYWVSDFGRVELCHCHSIRYCLPNIIVQDGSPGETAPGVKTFDPVPSLVERLDNR